MPETKQIHLIIFPTSVSSIFPLLVMYTLFQCHTLILLLCLPSSRLQVMDGRQEVYRRQTQMAFHSLNTIFISVVRRASKLVEFLSQLANTYIKSFSLRHLQQRNFPRCKYELRSFCSQVHYQFVSLSLFFLSNLLPAILSQITKGERVLLQFSNNATQ